MKSDRYEQALEDNARESVRKAVAASKKSYPNRYVCPNCGCYPIDRPGTLEREIKHVLNSAMNEQKGEPVSDLDKTYRRGWRDCIRALREYFRGLYV